MNPRRLLPLRHLPLLLAVLIPAASPAPAQTIIQGATIIVGGTGGGGSGNISGTLTAGHLVLGTGTQTVGPSIALDNGTILTYPGTGGIASQIFTMGTPSSGNYATLGIGDNNDPTFPALQLFGSGAGQGTTVDVIGVFTPQVDTGGVVTGSLLVSGVTTLGTLQNGVPGEAIHVIQNGGGALTLDVQGGLNVTGEITLSNGVGADTQVITSQGPGLPAIWSAGGGGGGGSGTVSGQAAGVIPLGTGATVIANQSHLDDGVTNSGAITSSEPIFAKVVNGVSYAQNYSGTATAQLIACLSDAFNGTNGNTTHKCNAAALSGNQTLTSEIDVGSTAGTLAQLQLPCFGTWQWSMTGGTAVGLKQNGGSEVYSECGVAGISGQFYLGATGGSNLFAIYEAVANAQSPYIHAYGFNILNSAGHATASHYSAILDGGLAVPGQVFSDATKLELVNVNDFSNPSGGGALLRNFCCGATWENSAFNANGGGTPVTVQADSTSYIQGLNFLNDTFVSPGAGKHAFSCTDSRSPHVSDITIIGGPYNETSGSDTTTSLYGIDGCSTVTINNVLAASNVANSVAPVVSVTATYATALSVANTNQVSGTGTWTYPATAVVNANDTAAGRSPFMTNSVGNFGWYSSPTVPSALGLTSLANGSTAPTQVCGTNNLTIATTAYVSSCGTGGGSPITTLGDVIAGNLTGVAVRIAGNTSTTAGFLSETGNGTISATPTWVSSSGTGNVALTVSPQFVTPYIGAATGLSLELSGPYFGIHGAGTTSFTYGATAQVGTGGGYSSPVPVTGTFADTGGGEATFTTGSSGITAAGTVFTALFPGLWTTVIACSTSIRAVPANGVALQPFMEMSNSGGTQTGTFTTDVALALNTTYHASWGFCDGQ